MTTSYESPYDISEKPCIAPREVPVYGAGGRVRIEALISKKAGEAFLKKIIQVCGWAKSVRVHSSILFIELTDGSSPKNLQVVVDLAKQTPGLAKELEQSGTSTSFKCVGTLVESPKEGQVYELSIGAADQGHSIKVLGTCDKAKYPLAKKYHSPEHLRGIQHLRPRSYFIGAVMRVRNALAHATHTFFQSKGFLYIHTPIITAADCEGAGQMFQVTTILPESDKIIDVPTVTAKKPKASSSGAAADPATGADQPDASSSGTTKPDKRVDYRKDFFGRKSFLTVSGQLALENFCCSLSDVYTFGPTFRAENSHTTRHLSEFWMIEPEIAFADLEDNMVCAESYLRFCVQFVLDRHMEDLLYFEGAIEAGLVERLKNIAGSEFARCSYTEGIEILKTVASRFEEKDIVWGMDLGSEHERYLSEVHFKKPVILYNYPYDLKAFYMKVNPVDEAGRKTVRAMDVLVPKVGEVIGGSQREESLELLDAQIRDKGLKSEDYWWYRELRQYGSVPHSGFGLGFERLIMMVTGVENIRDCIPFPRYPGNAEF